MSDDLKLEETPKKGNSNKALIIVPLVIVLVIGAIGAMLFIKPYQKPIIKSIEHHETAFLIPLVGDNMQTQTKFASEEYLADKKVATKEVTMPMRWISTGRLPRQGYWREAAKLIIVDRSPVTREWTEERTSGTSSKNEGIIAESKESIGFMARFNCTAMIREPDSERFLYLYPNKSLADVMDTEIRAMIESRFNEICSAMTLKEIQQNKGKIIGSVRDEVIPYFADRGITITVLGWKGELTYLNHAIQEAIDKEFREQKLLDAQIIENERIIAKAQAEADAARKREETIDIQLKLKKLEIMENYINVLQKSWDGQMPKVMSGDSGMLLDLSLDQLQSMD